MSGGKGWANPAPAGLVALAVACFIFFALLSGRVTGAAIPLMGCWLIGGFVVQVIVAVIELMEGASTGGNVFTFFSAFFMLTGGLEFFVKYAASINKWPLDATIDGWAWLVLSTSLLLWTPAYFKSPLIWAVLALDVACPLVAFIDMGVIAKATFAPIAAWALLVAGCVGMYVAAAIILNTEFGRKVLPMPSPLVKPAAPPPVKTAGH